MTTFTWKRVMLLGYEDCGPRFQVLFMSLTCIDSGLVLSSVQLFVSACNGVTECSA